MAASSRPFRLGIRNAYARPLYHWARTWTRTFAVEVGGFELRFFNTKKHLVFERACPSWSYLEGKII